MRSGFAWLSAARETRSGSDSSPALRYFMAGNKRVLRVEAQLRRGSYQAPGGEGGGGGGGGGAEEEEAPQAYRRAKNQTSTKST